MDNNLILQEVLIVLGKRITMMVSNTGNFKSEKEKLNKEV